MVVQRKCVDLANQTRGLFRIHGMCLPSRNGQAAFDEQVDPIAEAKPEVSHALLPLLDAGAVLLEAYRELDRRVKHVASHDETHLPFAKNPGRRPNRGADV